MLQFLTLSCRVVTKGHTYFNKFAGLFKYIWRFGTTWCWNGLKRSKDMYQNQSQNLSKIWSFGTNFSFQGVIQNTKKLFFFLTRALHEVIFSLRISLENVRNTSILKCSYMVPETVYTCDVVPFSCVFYMLWAIEVWRGSLFPRTDYEGRI